ncbi:MAG: hypothetical protein LBC73_01040 [Oscillospiraceae bacterium]|jgi:DNA-binding MarR family transcriptional regulator|nr:hypothetical protein [Oscillospiraceae bacterium]
MSDKQISKSSGYSLFPKHLGSKTLDELTQHGNADISIKDNHAKIKTRTEHESIMIEIRRYPDAITISQHSSNKTKPVSKQTETVKKLREEGRTQVETADILGTTQSNIAKIEKKMKEENLIM